MHVYGEVAVFESYDDADSWLAGLTMQQPVITGWYGFYKERGEQVTAVGISPGGADTFEYSYGVKDIKVVNSYAIQTRWVGAFQVLECAWFEDVAAWADSSRPPAPERGPSRGEPWEVEGWVWDLESGTWLEIPLPALQTWFLVCRYWGFASRVGANLFHVFG